jgi:hypothetical protein
MIAEAAAEEASPSDSNFGSALTDIPKDLDTSKADYKESLQVYEKYWAECTDSYIFGIETSYEISIDQLQTPPADLNIRSLEDGLLKHTLHYLLEMPDQNKKLTLCPMPIGLTEKPTSWEEIKDGQFYMINGQHSVEASKIMRTMSISEKMKKKFAKWDCFIVGHRPRTHAQNLGVL